MKMCLKQIKEAPLRVFITEQMVLPGPYWHLTAAHTSAGIRHESKRDFATWSLLRKQNAWLWKGSDWSLHHTRKPWRGGWTALDFCVDLSWGGGKRGGVSGKGELGKLRSLYHCGWYGAALCFCFSEPALVAVSEVKCWGFWPESCAPTQHVENPREAWGKGTAVAGFSKSKYTVGVAAAWSTSKGILDKIFIEYCSELLQKELEVM